ncbi:MAG: TldD/PmbA family protein [Dissulfurispiraceae bacterium]|jgi:PmbA protein|nr:TldD/PmbA family protein [Dissulfurispiraceae bacterium]
MDKKSALQIIEEAIRLGADEAEIFAKRAKSLNIEVKDCKIDALDTSLTSGYGLRIIKDRRIGFAYSSGAETASETVKKALEAAAYTEQDDANCLPDPSEYRQVAVFDPAVATITDDEAINAAVSIELAAKEYDSRIKKIRKAAAGFTTSQTLIVNSKGIAAEFESTGCSGYITAIAEANNENQMAWDYQGSRYLKNVSFESIGRNAALKAVQLLNSRKIQPMKGFVLIDSSVAVDFIEILASALSAEAVQKQRSFLGGKTGELVADQKINIIDNGLIDERLGSRPFDDEGVPVSRQYIIEEGVLNGFFHNSRSAKRDNTSSTGNAVRGGFSALPSIGPSNMYLEPTTDEYRRSFNKLIRVMGRGLYVTETMGMHTANPVTGDFSVGASGLWIESGEIIHPAKEAMISGSILTLFKNIVMVGDDLRFYGNIGSPSLLIDEIDITG